MIRYFTLGIVFLTLFACSFNEKTANQGAKFLQGEWKQDTSIFFTDLIEQKKHHFKFTCDSFYLILNNYSKANFSQDTCYKNGRWTEYVKGVYSLNGDTIMLKGAYVSHTFKLKKSPCYITGGFEETFFYQSLIDSTLVLKSIKSGKMILKLRKQLSCVN